MGIGSFVLPRFGHTPHSIAEIFSDFRELGAVTGHLAQAEELKAAAHARLRNVIELTKKAPRRPRVLCLEWIDPYYCCGIGCRKWLNLPVARTRWDAKVRILSAFRGRTSQR